MVVAAAQRPADAEQRVVAAPAVPGQLLADAAADVVDVGEPEPHPVERVEHPHGVRR